MTTPTATPSLLANSIEIEYYMNSSNEYNETVLEASTTAATLFSTLISEAVRGVSQDLSPTPGYLPPTSTASTAFGSVFASTRRSVPSFIPIDHPYIVFARDVYVWLVPIMVSILTVSIIGNGLIVLSAPWLGRHINPYNRLCISLAAADAWAASLLIAGLMVNSYMPVVLRIQKKSECIAAALEIFRISGMLTSNLHILALAINQFIGIVYPLKYKMIVTTRRVRVLILILWLLPIIAVGTWFVSIPNDGFRHPRCTHRFYSRFPFRLSVFTSFIIPLFITFGLYALILATLLKAKAKYNSPLRHSTRSSYRRRVKSKLKLVWTTLLILSTFTLSWGVCVLYFLLVCIEGCTFIYLKSVSFHAGFLMNSSVNFLVTLKLLLNPLIYALRMQHIRDSVMDLLRSICLRRRPVRSGSTLPQNQTMDTELVSRRCSSHRDSQYFNGDDNNKDSNRRYSHISEQQPLTVSQPASPVYPLSARMENGICSTRNRLRNNLARFSNPLDLFRPIIGRCETGRKDANNNKGRTSQKNICQEQRSTNSDDSSESESQ
ncbi:7 transmembrane receptor (rhodopsin family) domain-containing protein [Ditylenchus destructor]|uniref:7 transmembrane receptor (Rhodopsin family) domain-containing protein n=1 Tax=Ditylenchus destructor TaxID=166010 RepID=A0AAD4NDX0_9BILA|nr:7 transmembrane receptor (rhodopsin family) domain-containing protein [Ditylenchus destructor]